jgi:von Willebrand factor type A domain
MPVRLSSMSLAAASAAVLGLAGCGGGAFGGDGADAAAQPSPADAAASDAACPGVTFQPTPVTPSVALLLDQSSSMTSDFGATSRYQAMHQALTDPQTGVVTLLQDKVIFGASLYTSHNGGQLCPLLTSVPRQLGNRDLIDALLASNQPDDDTPTGESIEKVLADFQASPPPAGSPPIILLATDGEPDTCAQPDPNMGEAVAIAAAQHAHATGIDVYVLGVGGDVGAAHLQDMANAGVGMPVGGQANAPYYVATDPAGLSQRIQQIIDGIRSCDLPLTGQVDPAHAADGTVTLDGATLTYGTDWDLVDPTTIRLLGAACDTMLSADAPRVVASWPCGSAVP